MWYCDCLTVVFPGWLSPCGGVSWYGSVYVDDLYVSDTEFVSRSIRKFVLLLYVQLLMVSFVLQFSWLFFGGVEVTTSTL